MVNRNLLRQFDLPENELQQQLEEAFYQPETGAVADWLPQEEQEFEVNKIVKGRVLSIIGDDVVVDVGYKSEGVIKLEEWYDEGLDKIVPPQPGEEIQVLLDAVEDESGAIVLSYRKAKRQKEWRLVIEKHKEGDIVEGLVTRKIKGGLLVNIGVNVFLPASQVDIRRPPDIADYIGKTIECKILKIDEARRNIVVSRRKLLEDQRTEMKEKLLREIEPGQLRKGVVKNIAEFGAFVDLGGIDGLLHVNVMSYGAFVKLEPGIEGLVHISEMSWTKRINHPSELVQAGDQIEVQVLNINREKQEISLGMKQVQPNPWDKVAESYPPGKIVQGKVRNLTNYGVFVELEQGVDGLLHISELADHKVESPEEVVKVGDPIEVKVLRVDAGERKIGLSRKRLHWTKEEGEEGDEAPAAAPTRPQR